jgi:hypothetical protein
MPRFGSRGSSFGPGAARFSTIVGPESRHRVPANWFDAPQAICRSLDAGLYGRRVGTRCQDVCSLASRLCTTPSGARFRPPCRPTWKRKSIVWRTNRTGLSRCSRHPDMASSPSQPSRYSGSAWAEIASPVPARFRAFRNWRHSRKSSPRFIDALTWRKSVLTTETLEFHYF